MIHQLFKLMWNSKRNHSLLIIEIFFSFLALFTVLSFLIYQYANYVRPMGFESDNVLVVWFENSNADSDYLSQQKTAILNRVKAFEEVVSVTVSSNAIPFGMTRNGEDLHKEDHTVNTRYILGDENYAEVMHIPLAEGAWFNTDANNLKYQPIIINRSLKEDLFGTAPALGQILNKKNSRPKKVVGIIDNYRWRGDFQELERTYIAPMSKNRIETLLIKVKEGTTAKFEGQLSKAISAIAKGYQIEIEHLTDKREFANSIIYIPGIIMLIVCGFLIFNVVLGLFGILLSNINKRKGEIGTRRAMGATQFLIAAQFVGEIVIITTFALLIGCFFAIQLPLMGVFGLATEVYIKAIFIAVLVIYLLVIICAFYPSWQASKIHPAVALHAD